MKLVLHLTFQYIFQLVISGEEWFPTSGRTDGSGKSSSALQASENLFVLE